MSFFNAAFVAKAAARAKRDRERERRGKGAALLGAALQAALKAGRALARRTARRRASGSRAGRAGRSSGSKPICIFKQVKFHEDTHRYISRPDDSRLIDTNMPAGHAGRETAWARDQARHPGVDPHRVLCHIVLSRPAGGDLTDQGWRDLAGAWMREAGFEGEGGSCKYTAWLHMDTPDHPHIHLLVSRAHPDGSLVSDSNSFWRWREALRRAEQEVGLAPPAPKDKDQDKTRQGPRSDRARAAEQRAKRRGTPSAWIQPELMREALARATTPDQLQRELLQRGIEMRLSLDKAGQPKGLLLRKQGAEDWLGGSSIDRAFGLPKIQAQLSANANQHQQQRPQQQQQQRQRQQRQQQHPRQRGG